MIVITGGERSLNFVPRVTAPVFVGERILKGHEYHARRSEEGLQRRRVRPSFTRSKHFRLQGLFGRSKFPSRHQRAPLVLQPFFARTCPNVAPLSGREAAQLAGPAGWTARFPMNGYARSLIGGNTRTGTLSCLFPEFYNLYNGEIRVIKIV
jgi:hypothetical protein